MMRLKLTMEGTQHSYGQECHILEVVVAQVFLTRVAVNAFNTLIRCFLTRVVVFTVSFSVDVASVISIQRLDAFGSYEL